MHLTWKDLKGIMLIFKKLISIGRRMYDSIFITVSAWHSYRNGEPVSGHQGLGMLGESGAEGGGRTTKG